jgi:hypothetical protein
MSNEEKLLNHWVNSMQKNNSKKVFFEVCVGDVVKKFQIAEVEEGDSFTLEIRSGTIQFVHGQDYVRIFVEE